MNRLAVACVLASCGVPAAPGGDPEPHRVPAVDDLAAHVSLATSVEKPPRPLYEAVPQERPPPTHVITAVPTNLMTALAITSDGKTAVSVDSMGAMRLWPTLDGTREPVVVPARTAVTLAVEREGDEVVIAGLDAVGQLELVHTSALGLETTRIAVEAERPLVDVRIVGSRIVAVRDDQQLVAFDTHGILVGELAPDPGERVASIQVQHGRALVVVTGTHIRGRWLDLGTTIAWGASTAPLAIHAKREVALAPDGLRLAATSRNGQKIVILDLATGKVLRTTANVKAEESASLAPIGFLDDDTLAEAAQFRLMVWKDGTTTEVTERGTVRVTAGGKLVADSRGSLSITTGAGTKYLGYAMPQLLEVAVRPDGLLAADGNRVVRLDRTLHVDRIYQLPVQTSPGWHTLSLLDDHHVLLYSDKGGFIVDVDSAAEPTPMPIGGVLSEYRRDTHVIVMRNPNPISYFIARFDGATGTFTTPVEISVVPTFGSTVTLLDPAVARGNVAAIAESVDGDQQVRITELHLKDGEVEVGRSRTVTLDHQFWQDQAAISAMVHDQPRKTARGRDGELAVLDDGSLTLRAKGGAEKWSRRIASDTILWTSRGELLVSGRGLGELDLQTGVFTRRQCGWLFGLYEEPVNGTGAEQGGGLCDAHD